MKHRIIKFVSILLISIAVISCRTGDPRGKTMGQDYLDTQFQCTSGPLPHENDAAFTLIREMVRTMWANENKANARIVFTGDSTMALFANPRIQKYLPGYDIANRGIAGDTSSMLLARLQSDVVPLHPQTVVIVIGGNDLLQGRCMKDALENTKRVFASLKQSLPGSKIIMVSIPPVVSWKANSITPYYNRRLEYIARDTGIQYLDLWPALADPEKPALRKEYIFTFMGKEDQVHFNEEGYQMFAQLLKPLM